MYVYEKKNKEKHIVENIYTYMMEPKFQYILIYTNIFINHKPLRSVRNMLLFPSPSSKIAIKICLKFIKIYKIYCPPKSQKKKK